MARFFAVLGVFAFGLVGAAQAEDLTFTFDNEYSGNVEIEFYSVDRDHVWPGNGEVYVLGPSDGYGTYPLICQPGETICFGAWTQDGRSFWGAGKDLSQNCEGCCAQCGGVEPEPIELY